MSSLSFELDTTGDAGVRDKLASSGRGAGNAKMTANQKRKRLLAQEQELAQLVFDTPGGGLVVPDEEEEEEVGAGVAADSDDEESDAEGGDDDDDGSEKDDDDDDDDDDGSGGDIGGEEAKEPASKSAAWHDDDDDTLVADVSGRRKGVARLKKLRKSRAQTQIAGPEYVASLRRQFESVQPDTSWAALPEAPRKRSAKEDEDDESEEETEPPLDADAILRTAGPLVGGSALLPPDVLSVRRLTDLNQKERSASITPCVQWHPNGKLALTAGPDKTLRLFRTDGSDNPKLQSVHVPQLPINSAAFSSDGSQVYMCGRAKHWVFLDLHSGAVQTVRGIAGRNDSGFQSVLPSPAGGVVAMIAESGAVLLLSSTSKQLISTLQPATGGGRFATQSAAFSADGSYLYTSCEGAAVRVWDVHRRCCVHTWSDRGGLRCTALATSTSGEWIAAGSDAGAVNIYRTTDVLASTRPPPVREFLNLTSAVTTLEFNPTSELLAIASKYQKRAMRIVHVAGRHVFQNWPTSKSPLNYVQATAFAPHSGYMGIGTDQGKVLLYQLNHYAGT